MYCICVRILYEGNLHGTYVCTYLFSMKLACTRIYMYVIYTRNYMYIRIHVYTCTYKRMWLLLNQIKEPTAMQMYMYVCRRHTPHLSITLLVN